MPGILEQFNTIWAFLGIVLGFGFVIFVHELGHFLAAKWVGIKVTQFAVGFGHALLAWRKGIGLRIGSTEKRYNELLAQGADPATLGETEYRLNWMPLGGYVKMLGQEDLDPSAKSDDPRAFSNKPIWARAVVVCAGVTMNIIFGFIFFVLCFMKGVDFPPAVVGPVDPSGPAANAYAVGHENDPAYRGLQPGDEIIAVDGEPVGDFMDVTIRAALSRRDTPIEYAVKREGEPKLLFRYPASAGPLGLLWPGFDMPESLEVENVIELESAPADPRDDLFAQGVEADMRITAVDGKPIENYGQLHQELTARRGLPAKVTFTGEESIVTVDLHAEALLNRRDKEPVLLGFLPAVKVEGVLKDSPAEQAGIKAGDYLAALGSLRWPTASAVQDVVTHSNGQPLSLTVLRDGKEMSLPDVTANRKGQIGVAMGFEKTIIAGALPDSPAQQLTDLFPGSRIISVNGQPVTTFSDVQRVLQESIAPGKEAQVVIGYELAIKDQPRQEKTLALNAQDARTVLEARWSPVLPNASLVPLKEPVVAASAGEAAAIGVKKTKHFAGQVYVTLLRLTQGTVKVSNLSGPVGIAHAGTRVAKQGWPYLFYFLGLISVNLAVVNFLPIPITDGGLMIFLIIEKIKGSPVSAKVQTAAFFVGIALLGSVFLITLFYDSSRLFFGG